MGENNIKFEKLSFWQLLEKESIVIPIIQRGYAQGRESQRKIRDNFLDALYIALTLEPKKPVELDFIYGSRNKDTYQPLDGQQRLTTLFLLHWYIAVKESKADDFKKRLEKKFSFETRTSSLEFCNELIKKSIEFSKLLNSNTDDESNNKNNNFSEIIKNSPWFVSSWEKDPTVAAMLVMLDAIHLIFKNENGLWEKLIEEKEPRITFQNVVLEDLGLSDDLYIKMNARGKPLTPFENFKSQFEKYIEEKKFEENITNPEEKFAHKIDTIWTDLFWKYREIQEDVKESEKNSNELKDREEQKNNVYNIDNKIIKFIAGAAINYYAEKREIIINRETAEIVRNGLTVKNEMINQRIGRLLDTPEEIIPEDFPTKSAFQYLMDCFNKYSEKPDDKYIYAELKPCLSLWNYLNESLNSLFKDFIKYSANPQYKPRVLFYAQTVYLLKNNKVDEMSFSEWMRVTRNIVENSSIDQVSSFASAIRLINELSNGCGNIYAYLVKEKVSEGHAKDQVKEETEKAKIFDADKKNKILVHKTEELKFCKGRIYFALYCIDYDIDKNHDVSEFNHDKLEKIYNVFIKYFSGTYVDNDFRRALFSIGNNDFYHYWTSTLWAIPAPKKAIITNLIDLKDNFTYKWKNKYNIFFIDYLKELIVKLKEKDLNSIIEEYKHTDDFDNLKNWKKRIIEEENLLEGCKDHYMAVKEDDSCCWLIREGSKVAVDNNWKKKVIEVK